MHIFIIYLFIFIKNIFIELEKQIYFTKTLINKKNKKLRNNRNTYSVYFYMRLHIINIIVPSDNLNPLSFSVVQIKFEEFILLLRAHATWRFDIANNFANII